MCQILVRVPSGEFFIPASWFFKMNYLKHYSIFSHLQFRKANMKKNTFLLLTLLVLSACSGNNEKTKISSPQTLQKEQTEMQAEMQTVVDDQPDHPGLPLYKLHCLPCHQADGNGVPGMYPSLQNTKWVNGDVATLLDIVVNGMDGEIEVNGEYFNSIMAPLPHLNDQEVASLLSYVRKEFGTDASEVSVSDIESIRNPG